MYLRVIDKVGSVSLPCGVCFLGLLRVISIGMQLLIIFDISRKDYIKSRLESSGGDTISLGCNLLRLCDRVEISGIFEFSSGDVMYSGVSQR